MLHLDPAVAKGVHGEAHEGRRDERAADPQVQALRHPGAHEQQGGRELA